MKAYIRFMMLILVFLPVQVNAECDDLKCSSVKIESIDIGVAGPLVKTTGSESNLECSAVYDTLSILVIDSSWSKVEALVKVAKDNDLKVDLYFYENMRLCAIKSITAYSGD